MNQPTQPTVLTAADTFAGIDPTQVLNEGAEEAEEAEEAEDDEVEAVVSVSLPACILMPDDAHLAKPDGRWVMRLYSSNCLDCNTLIPSSDVEGTLKKCHHTKGNAWCPGANAVVEFVGAKFQLLRRGREAQASGSPAKVMQFLTKLQDPELDEDVKLFVMRELGFIST